MLSGVDVVIPRMQRVDVLRWKQAIFDSCRAMGSGVGKA